ncbi:tRNA (guanine(9)-N(1))-methyltransferase [Rhizina undulata]
MDPITVKVEINNKEEEKIINGGEKEEVVQAEVASEPISNGAAEDKDVKPVAEEEITGEVMNAETQTETSVPTLSKSALKKIMRREKFVKTRAEWKAAQKAKDKERKLRKREENRAAAQEAKKKLATGETGTKRKSDDEEGGGNDGGEVGGEKENGSTGEKRPTKRQKVTKPKKVLEPMTFILDCGFDELMTDKEVVSLSSQLTRCYSANRQSNHQVSLQLTSLNGRLLDRFQGVLKDQHLKWKNVTFLPEEYDISEVNKENLVYLTADSDDTIEELEPGKSYIIGGIVDRNRHKNLCYKKAVGQGIKTGKLPIGEYIKMASRFVLTTNQVVEIMLKWLECKNWKEAFMDIIPQRKMPSAKAESKNETAEGGAEEGEGQEGEAGEYKKAENMEVAKASDGCDPDSKLVDVGKELGESGNVVVVMNDGLKFEVKAEMVTA